MDRFTIRLRERAGAPHVVALAETFGGPIAFVALHLARGSSLSSEPIFRGRIDLDKRIFLDPVAEKAPIDAETVQALAGAIVERQAERARALLGVLGG